MLRTDLNGVVNSADLTSLSPTGTKNATWSMGDFNYDGVVNADDYALFVLGETYGGSANISSTVPEPSLLLVAGGIAIGIGARRRRMVAGRVGL